MKIMSTRKQLTNAGVVLLKLDDINLLMARAHGFKFVNPVHVLTT